MIVAVVIGLSLMQFTTPATIHPIGLLVFFLCLYAVFLGTLTYVIYFGHIFVRRIRQRRLDSLSLWRSYQFASVIALAPVMLIAMRTVGSVTTLDVVFIGLFVAVAVFYIVKRG